MGVSEPVPPFHTLWEAEVRRCAPTGTAPSQTMLHHSISPLLQSCLMASLKANERQARADTQDLYSAADMPWTEAHLELGLWEHLVARPC